MVLRNGPLEMENSLRTQLNDRQGVPEESFMVLYLFYLVDRVARFLQGGLYGFNLLQHLVHKLIAHLCPLADDIKGHALVVRLCALRRWIASRLVLLAMRTWAAG